MENMEANLSSLKIKNEENLILELDPSIKSDWNKQEPIDQLTSSGFCQRKVASDGACLFNAVSLAIDGDVTKSDQIRQEIAAIIL